MAMDKVELTDEQRKAFGHVVHPGEVREVYQGYAEIIPGINIIVYLVEVMRDAEICFVPITMMTPFIDMEHSKRALNALFAYGLPGLRAGYEVPEQPSKGN